MVAVGVLAALASGMVVWRARTPAAPQVARFAVTLGSYQVATRIARNMVAVSPDGTRIAYVVDRELHLKNLRDVEGRPISGSLDGQAIVGPVFSPDGEAIAYYSWGEQAIRRIPAAGGAATIVCATRTPNGLAWNGDSLYFGQPEGLMRVAANGGTPEMLIAARSGEKLFGPQLLPGGKALLFSSAEGGLWTTAGKIVVQTSVRHHGYR
jgi:hypothetical protein